MTLLELPVPGTGVARALASYIPIAPTGGGDTVLVGRYVLRNTALIFMS